MKKAARSYTSRPDGSFKGRMIRFHVSTTIDHFPELGKTAAFLSPEHRFGSPRTASVKIEGGLKAIEAGKRDFGYGDGLKQKQARGRALKSISGKLSDRGFSAAGH